MSKWIAEFNLEDGDTMPEHMDLEYKGVKLDFHCRPQKPILDKIRAEILRKSYGGFELGEGFRDGYNTAMVRVLNILDKYKSESEE